MYSFIIWHMKNMFLFDIPKLTLTCRLEGLLHQYTLHDHYSQGDQDSQRTHIHYYTSQVDKYRCGWSYHILLSIKEGDSVSNNNHKCLPALLKQL